MRAIARRLEQIEKAAVLREPETWISMIEPEIDAPESEWNAHRARVAKAETEGKNLIIHRII